MAVTLYDETGGASAATLTSGADDCRYVVVVTATTLEYYTKIGATAYRFARRSQGIGGETPGAIVGVSITETEGIQAPNFEFPGQYGAFQDLGNVSGAVTVDWNGGNVQRLRLTGDVVLTFSNSADGRRVLLVLEQDTTGSRLVTWPSTPTVRWAGGAAPTLTTTAGGVDTVAIVMTPTVNGREALCAAVQNF